MAVEDIGAAPARGSGRWRGVAASVGALLATGLLAGLMIMVASSNAARDRALAQERHSYDVMLLTRTVDGTLARAEATLGRYVMDEQPKTGTAYYNEWVLAGQQMAQLRRLVGDTREQLGRVEQLRSLYERRDRELAAAAAAAARHKETGGIPLFYQAGQSPLGPELRARLAEIADAERDDLRERMADTRASSDRADQLTEWFGWLAVLIGLGAVILGLLAFRAMRERIDALREADSEATRAQRLEQAVQQRTQELLAANERLKAEAAEREAAEAQLRQVQKMEAVGQLTGGIAHDFNNMLAVVVGGLDLARRKLTGDRREVELHLENAMEGATRAAALTRRLLAFARAEPLLPTSVAPAELVEGMLDLVDRSIGERIAVRTRFPSDTWPVRVDTNQLENAILNLAVNARDAMEGEGEIQITVANCTLKAGEVGELPAGDYVRLAVADTGSGMPPEILEHVFEPFFTTKPVGKGTGLGLSQIFGFARQSGGDVAIASAVGEGTTVSLYLPRDDEAVPAAAAAEILPSFGVDAAQPPSAGAAVVLVVEDDPRVSRATVGALEELGYRPIACSNGRDALDLLARETQIELLITDVMMPEMTGTELVRRASTLYPSLAVLFVTGYVGEAGEAEDLAGYDILRKPFTVSALSDAVRTAIGRRASEWPPASRAAAAG
ncbi:MAG: response regulator [Alphaproteobacteria bacterium]|nr:response regulator [Alphaproteobacteria bacterium]MBV9371350.1 response regulator [Alphaproteobacteria bacterium]MBV9901814.1 response regulator [Alphaproteobacteria bacterium]